MTIVAATKELIDRAAEALAKGEIVAFPTEEDGLGANALTSGSRQGVCRQGTAPASIL